MAKQKKAIKRVLQVGKPRQLIKCVYGLRQAEKETAHLTLIHNDSTLMDMDAPECMPGGGAKAYLGLDRKLLFVSERVVMRGGS